MLTQALSDIHCVAEHGETYGADAAGTPEGAPHRPPLGDAETPEQRADRIAAITRAVADGTYDTVSHARLGADALFLALREGPPSAE